MIYVDIYLNEICEILTYEYEKYIYILGRERI